MQYSVIQCNKQCSKCIRRHAIFWRRACEHKSNKVIFGRLTDLFCSEGADGLRERIASPLLHTTHVVPSTPRVSFSCPLLAVFPPPLPVHLTQHREGLRLVHLDSSCSLLIISAVGTQQACHAASAASVSSARRHFL